jgi:hypothetical protein
MSPGCGAAISTCVAGATPSACGGGAAGSGAAGSAMGVVSSRWNSTNAISCGSPSSVTEKSFAVSPSTTRPLRSVTTS